MYTIIAFTALILSVVTTFLAIKGNYKMYWLGAIGIYIFSVMASFSIGQLTVGFAFIILALAIGYSLHLIKTKIHLSSVVALGAIVGFLMVFYVDDVWLFYPVTFLS